MTDFYQITIDDDNGAIWWALEAPKAEDGFTVLLGEDDPADLGISLSVMNGSKILDANGSTGWIYTVSLKTVEMFKDAGVTGWSMAPIRASLADGTYADLPALQVSGRADGIDYSTTTIDPNQPRWGKGFGIMGWDGSDLFMVEDKGYLFCSPRLREVIQDSGLTNMAVSPVEEIDFPISPGAGSQE
jgi:hypothetical protein